MDDTLWDGIIGEDDVIKINKFQKKNLILINKLIKKGFISGIVSKNNLIDVKNDGSFKLNQNYFDYATGLTMTNNKFHNLFGKKPRNPKNDKITKYITI